MCASISMQHMQCCKLLKLKSQKLYAASSFMFLCNHIFTNISLVPRHHGVSGLGTRLHKCFNICLLVEWHQLFQTQCNTHHFFPTIAEFAKYGTTTVSLETHTLSIFDEPDFPTPPVSHHVGLFVHCMTSPPTPLPSPPFLSISPFSLCT